MDEIEKYPGQKMIDELWAKFIGSRHLTMASELTQIRRLDYHCMLPRKVVYNLYMTSKHWRMMKSKVLKRDEHKCVRCKSVVNLHVDHKKYEDYGLEDMDDLQTLCHKCHSKKTKMVDLEAKSPPKQKEINVNNEQLFTTLRRRT